MWAFLQLYSELICELNGSTFRNGAFSRRKPKPASRIDEDGIEIQSILIEKREGTTEQGISENVMVAPPSPSIAIPEFKKQKMIHRQPAGGKKEEIGQNNLLVSHEKKRGLKLLVFAHHHPVLDAIMGALTCRAGLNVVRIDGSTPMNKRQAIVEKFQNDDDTHVCLLAITAAGIGITLTAASMAVFAELSWTPGCMTQAEDRIHRIGQTAEEVSIVYLVAERSVDQQMLSSLQRKQATLKSTTGLAKEELGFGYNIKAVAPSYLPQQSGRGAGGRNVGQQHSISDVFNCYRQKKLSTSSVKCPNHFPSFFAPNEQHQLPTSNIVTGPAASSSMGGDLPPTDQVVVPLKPPPPPVGVGGTGTTTTTAAYLSPEVKAQIEASRQRAFERLKLKQLQRKQHPN